MTGMWSLLNAPPHTAAVYPVTKIMAAALYEAFEKNPEQFRERYREIMEEGGNVGITEVWERLLGRDVDGHKAFITARLDTMKERFAELKREMEALPDNEHPEKGDENVGASDDLDGAGDKPVLGHFTEKAVQRPSSIASDGHDR